MKKLFAYLFKWPLVYTEDSNGAVRLRKVSKTPFGKYAVHGISDISTAKLNSDGTTDGCSYVKKWKPANKYGEQLYVLFKLEE
jgi:hypothetical protein